MFEHSSLADHNPPPHPGAVLPMYTVEHLLSSSCEGLDAGALGIEDQRQAWCELDDGGHATSHIVWLVLRPGFTVWLP